MGWCVGCRTFWNFQEGLEKLMPMFVVEHLQLIKLITGFGTSCVLQGMIIISSPQLISHSLHNLSPRFGFLLFSKALVTGRSQSWWPQHQDASQVGLAPCLCHKSISESAQAEIFLSASLGNYSWDSSYRLGHGPLPSIVFTWHTSFYCMV